jgi:hypothetical protein
MVLTGPRGPGMRLRVDKQVIIAPVILQNPNHMITKLLEPTAPLPA